MDESIKLRILTREEILACDDLPEEIVPTPEWGEGTGVKVRGMTAVERLDWVELTKTKDGKGVDMEKAMFYSVILGVQEPKFSEADIPALKQKSAEVMDRISRTWLRLSGIGEEELLKARGNS